jgi:hypothetical protein
MERDCLEELGVDGRIILKCILQKYDRSVIVIQASGWQTSVKAVMKLWITKFGEFLE